jgi:hypothetical protein
MTKPRPLGSLAKGIVEGVQDLLEGVESEYFDVVLHIHMGEIEAAVRLLKEMKCATDTSEKVLGLLADGKLQEAEQVLLKSKKAGLEE